MFTRIIEWFKRLFKINPQETDAEATAKTQFVQGYKDISTLNLTAIISNKLANIVCADSNIEVVGGTQETFDPSSGLHYISNVSNARSELLNTSLQRVVGKLKTIVMRSFGTGCVILKPCVVNGQIYTDILDQDRLVVVEQQGEVITKAGIIAETIKKNSVVYTRVEYHSIVGDNYVIENKAIRDGAEVGLSAIEQWKDIPPVQTIRNVDRMLFALLRCPTDHRLDMSMALGVPITFGQDELIRIILDLYHEIPLEYINKRAFVGADDIILDENGNLPEDGIYRLLSGVDSDSFWQIFSPDIRNTSYFEGLDYLFGLLEKASGVNRGILTDMDTSNATATEIKRSVYDTWTTVDSMRHNVESAFADLAYAFDVLATVGGLAPTGEYQIAYDWSYGLVEDSTESFNQLLQAVSVGAAHTWELRKYIMDMSDETAQKTMPSTEQLLMGQ